MNNAGILHHDLHDGNVMVTSDGTVYIIDFDRARFVKNEESSRLGLFNASLDNNWEPKGIASKSAADFFYNYLLNEGSIVLLSKPAKKELKTIKNVNKSKRSKKSKKSKKLKKFKRTKAKSNTKKNRT
jgi:tRNA A-37 threonylcarbamoyl transferase component Bud32